MITPQHKHCRASFILCAVMLLYHKLFRPPARAQSPITQCQRGGKNSCAPLCSYFKDIPTRDQVHPYWPDSSGQEEPGTSEFTVIISHSPRAAASQHVKLFILSPAGAHFPLLCHCIPSRVTYSAFVWIICLLWGLHPQYAVEICAFHIKP